MGLRDRLTHSRSRSIAVHRSIHSDIDRIFHFTPLAFRENEKSSNNKEEDLHGIGHQLRIVTMNALVLSFS